MSSEEDYSGFSDSSEESVETCLQHRQCATKQTCQASVRKNRPDSPVAESRIQMRCRVSPSGKKKTVYTYGPNDDVCCGRNKFGCGMASPDMRALAHHFQQDLNICDVPSRCRHVPRSPKPNTRMRNASEPHRKLIQNEDYRRRTRTHIPLQGPRLKSKYTAASNTLQGAPTATRRLLSARKLRIDDLRNKIMDLERKIGEDAKERKVLANLCNRQQKELERVEESRLEIPEIEKAHDNEVRALKVVVKKLQEKNKLLEAKLRTKADDLQQRYSLCQNLKHSLQQKKRIEGETDKKIAALKMKIKSREETIEMLKENLSNVEKKLSEERMAHEADRVALKNIRKKYEELKRRSPDIKCEVVKYLSSPTSRENVKQGVTPPPPVKHDEVPTAKPESQNLEESLCAEVKEKLHLQNVNKASNTACSPFSERKPSPSVPKMASVHFSPATKPVLPSSASQSNNREESANKPSPKLIQWSTRNVIGDRKCTSADSPKRFSARARQCNAELSDAPLIVPSLKPTEPIIDSDSSNSAQVNSRENIKQSVSKAWERFQSLNFPKNTSQKDR